MDWNNSKRFGVYLDITLKLIRQDLIRRFRENDVDLTPEQWTVLAEVALSGSIYQKELAEKTFKDPPTVSRIIELMVEKGYMKRDPDIEDRRRFIVDLTVGGQALFEKAAPLVYEARKVGWNGLNDQDYNDLNRILRRINSNISAQ